MSGRANNRTGGNRIGSLSSKRQPQQQPQQCIPQQQPQQEPQQQPPAAAIASATVTVAAAVAHSSSHSDQIFFTMEDKPIHGPSPLVLPYDGDIIPAENLGNPLRNGRLGGCPAP